MYKQKCTYTSPIKKIIIIKKKKCTHTLACQTAKGSLDLVDWRLQLLPKEFDFSEQIKVVSIYRYLNYLAFRKRTKLTL